MSLKAKTHINAICEVWVITPHGARQQFGMLIFVHEMTSTPPPEHLTPLPCLLLGINWLPHHPLIISASGQDMLQLLPPHPHLILSAAYHASAPAAPSRYDPGTTTPCLPSPILMLLHPQDMALKLAPHLWTNPSLRFGTRSAYHAYAPAAPSRYASDTSTPCPPSPILTLPQPCHLQCLHSCRTLKICLQRSGIPYH
ncbi:hypothetical protein O181_077035 [Austropuccinia psidii MF-1]|uniref:Uncharacterized protein n=1 Tax=Austropuccinia psidii MF-1 TaxID=1389203 RepID=A0A9Q3FHB2_9BASI|nr:hypothetical protein [Austropuccinia psidii MF-1]